MLHVYFQFVKWMARAIHLELVVNNSEYTWHGEIYAPASLWFRISGNDGFTRSPIGILMNYYIYLNTFYDLYGSA